MNSELSVQKINWRQAIVEVTMIVAGVLIALAVDDWWEEKLERDAEISYLEALRQDFETNRETLDAAIREQENIINEGDELLRMIKAGLNEESGKEFFSKVSGGNLYFFRNWTPVTATYDDIINSGRLLYVENQQLRNELSRFRKSLEFVRQMERLQAETFYERQMPFLAENQDTNYSTWSEVYRPPVSPFSVDTAPFATLKYWNLVVEWIYVHVDVITNYRRAVADCDRILEIIENELESKAN
jgi:hypothetical protein